MTSNSPALTDKEKETLRLLLRGHDAKSSARELGLSVHTVNERLRDARRKLGVTSSREAARVLLATEAADTPESLGDKALWDAGAAEGVAGQTASTHVGWWAKRRFSLISSGVLAMSLIFAALLIPQSPLGLLPNSLAGTNAATEDAQAEQAAVAAENEIVLAAQEWLALVDAHDWGGSWAATGKQFRELNTRQKFAETAESVQPKLGATLSRTFLSQEFVPAPPAGYESVKFRTQFVAKPDTVETLALQQEEDGKWRVVGYWLTFDGEL
ncbi:DUF4019 domain-containing protein [Parerythrobacter aurantius]|uniref:helix-turn-helix domain-containing protein n=1 Tax=Parerythrobacter aurantius TaxID=3127706 RepID=UPI003253DFB6